MSQEQRSPDVLGAFRQLLALERDVLVLSVAMLAFSLSFQMTSRYVPQYLSVLGAGAGVIGLYGSVGNFISAAYPYPGGAFSDRIGSRIALTIFGVLSTLGFGIWLVAPAIGALSVGDLLVPVWIWIFVGLFFSQAWKSFGLGATFAIVKQDVTPDRLATGFASTETFRRIGFLVGPTLAAGLLAVSTGFITGFQLILGVAVVLAAVATVVQHVLYDASSDTLGKQFEGVSQIIADLRDLPEELKPLLIGDIFIRFGNGMVYAFFVIVVVQFLEVSVTLPVVGTLASEALFGVLLGIEMAVALVSMIPVSKLAQRVGLKPVVGLGYFVYAVFPILLINAPADPLVVGVLFAFSGLRFAGLPAHKAMIVGPAEQKAGGRVTGSYYLIRNTIVIPSAALGGWLYSMSPELAFGLATVVGLIGTGYFFAFGKEFDAYTQ
ncbi:MFS transporter [Halococcus thailandensis]|jgi:MFS family permease|uniref:Transporter n=1 Tax=Halococcus thailandensis JCM 13552 TaxID=1227457 RepID=M0NHH0_9EURY|nr:MFS transporter [Halococcus thailandensis]EMA56549.1 transporter [Halococcus thailandensis JCM 13552]